MTCPTLVRDLRHEQVLIDVSHLVGRVAVVTIGQSFLNLRIFDIVDAFSIFLVYPLMAGGTCGGDILIICGRAVILMVEDKVRAVTVCAHSAWEQAFFGQTLAMGAAGIVDHHIALLGCECGGVIQLTMTLPAQLGDIGPVGLIVQRVLGIPQARRAQE